MSLFRKSKDINEELIQFQNTKNAILLDVRSKEEYEMSHIPESINIGLTDIEKVNEIIKDKSTMIFVYCFSGARSEKYKKYWRNLSISGKGYMRWQMF